MAELKRFTVNYIIKGTKEVDAKDESHATEIIQESEYVDLTDHADDIELEITDVEERYE